MLTSRSLVSSGMVWALTIVPIVPSVLWVGDSGIVLVKSAVAQPADETYWNDEQQSNAEWDQPGNWDNGVPDPTVAAFHTIDVSDIQVNIDPAQCYSFEGDGGNPNDQFLRVDGGKTLQVANKLTNKSGTGNFLIRLQDGTSDDPTTVTVGGDVSGIEFLPARNHNADYVSIDVAGDVETSAVTVGDNGSLDIKGDVYASSLTIGTSTAGVFDGTAVKVGSMGEEAVLQAGDDVVIRGYSTLTVSDDEGYRTGNYVAEDDAALVTLSGASEMTVEGTTTEAYWETSDNAEFTGIGEIIGGVWELKGDSVVRAQDDVTGGDWLVGSDGGVWGWGVLATVPNQHSHVQFNPDLLVIGNGTVLADVLGFDNVGGAGSPNHPIWDMHFKGNATVQVDHEGWHEGAGSELKYENTNNLYKHTGHENGIDIGGPIVRVSNAELDIEIVQSANQGYFTSDSLLTDLDGNGDLSILQFDTEGVTMKVHNGACSTSPGNVEAIGPDYDGYWWEDGQQTPKRVFFTDVPCTKRWAELLIKDDSQSGNCTKLTDKKVNSIISGYDGSVPEAQFVRDAVYVIDLTVEENAELYTGVQFETGATDVRIYYTGTATIDGAIKCLDGTTNCGDRYYAIDTVTI